MILSPTSLSRVPTFQAPGNIKLSYKKYESLYNFIESKPTSPVSRNETEQNLNKAMCEFFYKTFEI